MTLAGLGVAGVALTSFVMLQPSRNARAFHASLRPGMSLADVAVAAWPHGQHAADDVQPAVS